MLLGVAEDVTDGGEGTSVATGWLEVSLGAVPVVVGCGGGTLVLGAGGLAPSVGVALGLPEAGEEAPSEVAGMVLEWKGVAVLRGVVKMEGAAGVLAEVAWTGEVLCVWWVLGPEEMIPVVGVAAGVGTGVAEAVAGAGAGAVGVGVAEVLARASVEPRSTVAVEVAVDGPAGPVDVASVVAGVELGAPVLTEEGGRVVDVCSVAEAGRGEVNADVRVLPGESMVEEVRTGARDGAVGPGVVTRRVLAALVVWAAEAEARVAVREVAGAAVSLGVATCVVDPVGVLAGGEGPAVVWVVGSVVVSVGRGLVFGVEAEAGSVLGAGGGERGTPVDEVRLWVATGVELVEAGA